MTPRQLKRALKDVGLSQRGSSKFFGVNERTVRRWITGELTIPQAVDVLLRLMIQHNVKAEAVANLIPLPRG